MRVCAIKDKTVVDIIASYRSVSKNPVRFKALIQIQIQLVGAFFFEIAREPTNTKNKRCFTTEARNIV